MTKSKKYRQIEIDADRFRKGWSCRVTYPSGTQRVVATHCQSREAAYAAGIRHAKGWYEIEDNVAYLLWLAS